MSPAQSASETKTDTDASNSVAQAAPVYDNNGQYTRAGILRYEKIFGHGYVSTGGHIGPLAVARPDAVGTAFRTALTLAAESGSSQVSAFLPGTCDIALSVAVAHGMRITFPMLLMSSRGMADWTQYLPRNPGYM